MDAEILLKIADTPRDIAAVKRLFVEYSNWLGVSLNFQGFDEEMETFPAVYDFLLLARVNGGVAGGIGLKDMGNGVCEMKRLFVRNIFKGSGLGRKLSEALVTEAKARGYTHMRLDTLPRLEAAVALYRKMGFVEIPAYYDNPVEDVIYMELAL